MLTRYFNIPFIAIFISTIVFTHEPIVKSKIISPKKSNPQSTFQNYLGVLSNLDKLLNLLKENGATKEEVTAFIKTTLSLNDPIKNDLSSLETKKLTDKIREKMKSIYNARYSNPSPENEKINRDAKEESLKIRESFLESLPSEHSNYVKEFEKALESSSTFLSKEVKSGQLSFKKALWLSIDFTHQEEDRLKAILLSEADLSDDTSADEKKIEMAIKEAKEKELKIKASVLSKYFDLHSFQKYSHILGMDGLNDIYTSLVW